MYQGAIVAVPHQEHFSRMYSTLFFAAEEREGIRAGDRINISKQIHKERALQDGVFSNNPKG